LKINLQTHTTLTFGEDRIRTYVLKRIDLQSTTFNRSVTSTPYLKTMINNRLTSPRGKDSNPRPLDYESNELPAAPPPGSGWTWTNNLLINRQSLWPLSYRSSIILQLKQLEWKRSDLNRQPCNCKTHVLPLELHYPKPTQQQKE
jgi:hypothetical protein